MQLMLKGEGKGPLSPLLVQYVELCDKHPDYLVLFQVGDFYECFGEDAVRLARALGLSLTHKTSKDFKTDMAGIPIRSLDTHIEKLLEQGIRVAIADQVQNASEAEGLVKRGITQLITPGTVTDEALLKPDANYVAAIATGDGYGLALLDVSTGEFRGTHLYSRLSLYDELQRYRPAEVLLSPELYEMAAFRQALSERFAIMLSTGRFDEPQQTLKAHFGTLPPTLRSEALIRAAAAALSYAKETQQGTLPQVTHFVLYDPGAYMYIGETALKTLEVFEAPSGSPSLSDILDNTRTAPGRRLFKAWLRHPLLDAHLIEQRLQVLAAFVHDGTLRQELRKILYRMSDLERLATRLATGRVGPREMVALSRSLGIIPEVKTLLTERHEPTLGDLNERLSSMEAVQQSIDSALVDNPPIKVLEGGLIQDGFDHDLDDLRQQASDGRAWLAALEAHERQALEIPTLKISYHGVFGYCFEVTRPYYTKVPESYRPVQTLKDRQRYTRADLRDKEREIMRAEERAKGREYSVYDDLRQSLKPQAERVRALSSVLAELDVLTSLAETAAKYQYCRPIFSQDGHLSIQGGRHPVVERTHSFIANDLFMNEHEHIIILTGPNMSGKSTYLRQTALICLLAQIGSFVPAETATLPIFERIYTRIGAQDDISAGRSTFMVEMSELADILQYATPKSLILLDEVGRGTSTYDGLSLAWAACEHLHHRVRAFTLFATHYFELTRLTSDLSRMRNYHVAAKEEAGGLTFYHQVLEGPASHSYGHQVAKLAGVPDEVLKRAREVMMRLEASHEQKSDALAARLSETDLSRLSPLEGLRLLYELQEILRGEGVMDVVAVKAAEER